MILYIVVEITSREFDAKTLLACRAALAGFDVVIGEEDMIRRLAIMGPPGIYFDKSVHTHYPALHRKLRRLGHRIVVNDDEGFIFNEISYRNHSLTPQACSAVDLHLTWGDYQQGVIEKWLPEFANKSKPVGNVRLDLLSSELRPLLQVHATELRKQWGRFVLINSRASVVNHVDGQARIDRLARSGESGPAELLKHYVTWDTEVFRTFQEMVPVVCKRFPDLNFIIRPHPTEDLRSWEQIAHEIPNAHLVREGNVQEWILASEMVIVQHGCSTAAETFFLDVPCLSYLPLEDERITHGLADNIAYRVRNAEEVCQCIAGERDKEMEAMRPQWTEAAKAYVATVDGPLAVDATIDQLRDVARIERRPDGLYRLWRRIDGKVRSWNRYLKIWLKGNKRKPHPKWRRLTLDEFKNHVRRFTFHDQRINDLEITSAYLDCFRLRLPRGK